MRKKMLISIALIAVLLLNCMTPLLVASAATGVEIQLNGKLYTAIKSSLTQQGLSYTGNDITHTFTLTSDQIASITELDLNEGDISDLTGLDSFTALTHLELSGNNIDSESNLSVLNNLSELVYLDLSTNQIDEISEISDLITRLQSEGTIILSGQTVTKVETTYIDTDEESDNDTTATFELPGILELAGYIKSSWKSVSRTPQTAYNTAPSVNTDSIPMYVTEDNKTIEINICSDSGSPYYGLLEVIIYIYDDATEAASANNPNKAAENILNGSRFYLYYIVYPDYAEAITTMDTNLYNAIKEQLTGGQTINSDLSSYPYSVDANGDVIYEEYTYTTDSDGNRILTNTSTGEVEYLLDVSTNTLYEYDGTTVGDVVDTTFESIVISTTDDEGNITSKAGYKVAFTSDETGETLYIAAYDDAKTFVIYDTVLLNKITSLILNNKQIRDLSGLEYFVGLTYDLNVSHNYLSDIDPIYDLDAQKDYWEQQLIEQYSKWLKNRTYGNLSTSTTATKTAMDETKTNMDSVVSIYNQILNLFESAGELDSTADGYSDSINEKASSIQDLLDQVYGSVDDEGNVVPGYLNLIEGYKDTEGDYIDGSLDEVNDGITEMYYYLALLYNAYNNEYRLTTLLSDSLNYITADEYDAYVTATTTTADAARALVEEEVSYLSTLEANGALSDLDKALFTEAFGINFNTTKTETPLATYFSDYLSSTALSRTGAVKLLNKFREIGLYSEMASYCLLERMNSEDVAEGYCYEEEYLKKRIAELEVEFIDTTLESDVLAAIQDETSYSSLYDVYKEYNVLTYTYTDEDGNEQIINMCNSEYIELYKLTDGYSTIEDADEILSNFEDDDTLDTSCISDLISKVGSTNITKIIKLVNIYENVYESYTEYEGEADTYALYNQLMSLAEKLINGNVERYVYLARLKKLDISYNADLDNIDRLAELTSLTELDASYCYIASVDNVDWASMDNLRKLSLAYNYISDITPFSKLTNLKYLDLSNNLLAGELEISEEECYQLFKNMEELNLSGNQLTDITSILIYLDYISGGSYANYLAREDTVNINLQNQTITIDLDESISQSEYPYTINIDLPKIFTQLLAIDTARTAFGLTSATGRIESEGTYVTLSTQDLGKQQAVVTVVAMSGDGTEVDTCIGEGTTAYINYKVVEGESSDTDDEDITITISPSEATVAKGSSQVFSATVSGGSATGTTVTWSVEGNTSEDTVISDSGTLTVGSDETATEINVVATSVYDTSVTAKAVVTVSDTTTDDGNTDEDQEQDSGSTTTATVSITGNSTIKVGEESTYYATVSGDVEDTTVVWSISGNNSENTTVSEDGTVTVGSDETATTITVTATLKEDTTVTKSFVIKISQADDEETIELGYSIDSDDGTYLIGVSPKTPVADFKTILLDDDYYTIVVLSDDTEQTTVTNGYIKTGMLVRIEDANGNTIEDENGNKLAYEIVVKGDVNGDGYANSVDSALIKAIRNEVEIEGFTKANSLAADINEDGKIDITDSKLLLYHRAEVSGYNLNYSK